MEGQTGLHKAAHLENVPNQGCLLLTERYHWPRRLQQSNKIQVWVVGVGHIHVEAWPILIDNFNWTALEKRKGDVVACTTNADAIM